MRATAAKTQSKLEETPPKPRIKTFEELRPEVTEELLASITARIVDAFHPHKVILFGSYAYGTPHIYSDIDLMVIMDSEETAIQRIRNVHAVGKISFLPMDVLVYTPAEVETRLAMGDYFVQEILERGKVLYQRDAT